ncbi:hypothetical protein BTW10_13080 [Chromohalobacter japonicus]|uniref:AAA+ ATPase domain-containing protein n=1 Tax=Chromohalobacter japonicus TaxID=223900 RepID=A0A1Q8TAD2_9GAMM|nr:AAA family ATPase [Chromohalobacter japonicus]OLO10634.1 hypothetical protein BTW10_13080 [Chromohalobacter japonicus]
MNPARSYSETAGRYIDATGGATLSEEVLSDHPALDMLLDHAVQVVGLDEEIAGDLTYTALKQITLDDATGNLLWRHEGLTEAREELAERQREGIHSEAPIVERHLFSMAIALLDEEDETLSEPRRLVKEHAIHDRRFTGVEPLIDNVVPLRRAQQPQEPSQAEHKEQEALHHRVAQRRRTGATMEPRQPANDEAPAKPTPKPKHQQWLDDLLADDDAELERIAAMPMLVNGLIPAESYGYVFGASGVGKSFVVLNLAHAVATGSNWLGEPDYTVEKPGIVVYVAAEGANGVRVRKRAMEQETGVNAPLLRILSAAPMMDGPDGHLLAETLKELENRMGEPVRMVVLDTLSQAMEGDQNAAEATGAFVRGCQEVQANGAAVAVVHHSGLSDENRMRGSTNLKAAGDFEFCIKGSTESTIGIHQTKAKDLEPLGGALVLKARKVTINGLQRANGEPMTSLVVEKASLAQQLNAESKLSANERTLMEVMQDQGSAVVGKDEARQAFYKAKGDSGSSARQAFNRALKSLGERQLVHANDDDLSLYMDDPS